MSCFLLVLFFFHVPGLFNLVANFLIHFAAFSCMLLTFLSTSWTEFICLFALWDPWPFTTDFRTSELSRWGVMIFWDSPMALSFHVHLFLSVVICTLLFGISLAFIWEWFPFLSYCHDKIPWQTQLPKESIWFGFKVPEGSSIPGPHVRKPGSRQAWDWDSRWDTVTRHRIGLTGNAMGF